MGLNFHTYKSDMAGTTWLYRAYDQDGRLLYVGITRNTASRFTRHRYKAAWWPLMDRIDTERFETRDEALNAEKVAIFNESPAFNVARPKVGA